MSLGKRYREHLTLDLRPLSVGFLVFLLRCRIPKLGQVWFLAAFAVLFACGCGVARSQEKPVTNPLAGNPAAIREGASLFRANCAPCHGFGAKGGGRGPDLTSGRWAHGSSDADIFRTVSQGVPGTDMPANAFEDSETWAIIAYIRSLSPAALAVVSGSAVAGEKIFWGGGGCSGCHMIEGNGGRLGPDLSRVGASRSLAYLIDSIREPSKDLSTGLSDPNNHYGVPLVYDTVTAVTADGQSITGVAKNEDTFSLQLLDTREELHLLLKSELKSVTHEHKSLMPAYSREMLRDSDLNDLVAYLVGLRGEGSPGVRPRASHGLTYERIVEAAHEPDNWLTYSGRYAGWRHSALDQINSTNAGQLTLQWAFQTGDLGQFETTPLIVDGVLYGTGQNDRAFALDARTGRPIWRYQRNLPDKLQPCCGAVNRGFAVLGNKLFMATLDAHVIALDTKTGNILWDTRAADYRAAYTFTGAPLVVKNEVIVGVSGGEYGVRGFVDAYDADTGRLQWRFDTVPGPGQPGHETWAGDSWKTGGAPAWITGSYDPDLNLVYWPTGNPSPSDYGGERGGDNLYSNCLLALDADTGKLKWHFQFTPHDLHDYDATQVPVLLDADSAGTPRKLVIQANRNGFLYVLDRTTGEFISAKPFGPVTWAKTIGADGRPVADPAAVPTEKGIEVCPGALGITNWYSPSYDPATKLLYVATSTECDIFSGASQPYRAGHDFLGSIYAPAPEQRPSGALKALDPLTGEAKWAFQYYSTPQGGALSTAGGVVFAGDADGNFIALDAASGRDLWRVQIGAAIYSAAVTYQLDGRQYVTIPAGGTLFAFALPSR
jgi:PQQ-dependent dehydrogenase (methanol/ethanol family)